MKGFRRYGWVIGVLWGLIFVAGTIPRLLEAWKEEPLTVEVGGGLVGALFAVAIGHRVWRKFHPKKDELFPG